MAELSDRILTEILAEMGRQRVRPAELARRLGRSEMYVSRRLNGGASISIDDLEDIAGALDVPVAQLLPSDVAA